MGFLDFFKEKEKAGITKLDNQSKDHVDSYFKIDLRPRLISLPSFSDAREVNVRYPLISPYAFAHITWNDEYEELVYNLEEPPLNKLEKELLRLIEMGLQEMINISYTNNDASSEIINYLEKNVQAVILELGVKVSKKSYLKIMYYIYRNFIGLNRIEPILQDYFIEDIECNGMSHPLYLVHRKFDNLRSNIVFGGEEELSGFVEKLAQKSGRYVSFAKPLLDGTLPDGSRINATYTKDVTTRGPTFTIRKFTKNPWTPIHLVSYGTASPEFFAFLWLVIDYKFNLMVIGETSSGKTTLLNSIMYFIPPQARICSIEDTREINLSHDNWLPAVTRLGFGIPDVQGKQMGEVSLFDLLKASFRQNPDYVIVGEIRGKEAFVLFQGMASGHPSFGTFHAASVETMIQRLQSPPISLSASLCESMDLVIYSAHIRQRDKSFRRVVDASEIVSVAPDGAVKKNVIFKWNPRTDQLDFNSNSYIFEKITNRTGITKDKLLEELRLRAELIRKMKQKHIMNFKDFTRVSHEYNKRPEEVLKEFDVKTEGSVINNAEVKTPVSVKENKVEKKPVIKDIVDEEPNKTKEVTAKKTGTEKEEVLITDLSKKMTKLKEALKEI